MNKHIKAAFLLMILSLIPVLTSAQAYELSPSGNKAVITGTSSLHDWEMDIARFTSGFSMTREGNTVKKFENVAFTCKSADIKSDNSIMNKKTQDALRSEKYPEIKFTGTSVSGLVMNGTNIKGTVSGKLTLAGQTHDISVPFSGTVNDMNVSINASADLTFSGYGMEPPTAMLGTLKTGDKVKVTFNLVYNEK